MAIIKRDCGPSCKHWVDYDHDCQPVVGLCRWPGLPKWEPKDDTQDEVIYATGGVKSSDEEEPGGSTPSQYALPEDAVELQDLIEYRNMNFAVGNIFKACYRLGNCDHSDSLRDMRKVLWFAQREIKRLEDNV